MDSSCVAIASGWQQLKLRYLCASNQAAFLFVAVASLRTLSVSIAYEKEDTARMRGIRVVCSEVYFQLIAVVLDVPDVVDDQRLVPRQLLQCPGKGRVAGRYRTSRLHVVKSTLRLLRTCSSAMVHTRWVFPLPGLPRPARSRAGQGTFHGKRQDVQNLMLELEEK